MDVAGRLLLETCIWPQDSTLAHRQKAFAGFRPDTPPPPHTLPLHCNDWDQHRIIPGGCRDPIAIWLTLHRPRQCLLTLDPTSKSNGPPSALRRLTCLSIGTRSVLTDCAPVCVPRGHSIAWHSKYSATMRLSVARRMHSFSVVKQRQSQRVQLQTSPAENLYLQL